MWETTARIAPEQRDRIDRPSYRRRSARLASMAGAGVIRAMHPSGMVDMIYGSNYARVAENGKRYATLA